MSGIIGALTFYLAAPIDGTQTSITVRGLKDARGTSITAMPSGVTLLYATIEPRSAVNQECFSFNGITDNGNGLVTLTGCIRNLNPQPPWTALAGNVPHSNNAEVILSNNPPFYSGFLQTDSNVTITGQFQFPTPTLPANPATKAYVDSIAISGAPDASTTAKGISRLSVDPTVTLGVATITIASPAVVSFTAHGLTVDDTVKFTTTGNLPTGLTPGNTYYVISTGLTANTFQLSATIGGTAINTSGSQSGTHTLYKTTPKAVGDNDSRLAKSLATNLVYGMVRTESAGLFDKVIGTPTITIASPAVFTLTSHGLVENDTFTLTTTGALPTGLAIATTYYVIAAGLTANTFQCALTLGGVAINTSGSQSGTHTLTRTSTVLQRSGTQVDVITASGTWTQPAGAKSHRIIAFGAGGGAGQGAGSGLNTGGAGGARNQIDVAASALTSTVSVTIGAGGGAGVAGGNTTFGSYLTAYGGGAGVNIASNYSGGSGGGQLGAGNAGNNVTILGGLPAATAGVSGAAGAGAGATPAASGVAAEYGGGSGGGVVASNASGLNGGGSIYAGGGGGSGAYYFNSGGPYTGGTGGGRNYTNGGGGAGGTGTGAGTAGTSRSGTGFGGDGGGGGGGQAGSAGGNGGAGGLPGGGGGGAGYGTSVGTSGSGGRGEIIVITSF